jgi:hypothetical protein
MTEIIPTDIVRLRVARLLGQRDAYRRQRDELADAIEAHRAHRPDDAEHADTELWTAYQYLMGREPDGAKGRPAARRD